MPRPSKPFSEYPQWILGVITKLASGAAIVQLPMQDRKAAISTSHMFNRGRAAFVRDAAGVDTALVEKALDIMCRVTNLAGPGLDGKYILEFSRRGLAQQELDIPELNKVEVPDIDSVADDEHDKIMQRILNSSQEHTNKPK